MLTFNLGESKSLNMSIDATGIDPSHLTYLFSIDVDNVLYGFKCTYKADKTSVTIPSLDSIIKNVKAGEYSAQLHIFGDKYYMCPFSEKVKIISPIKMKVEFEGDESPGKEKKVEVKTTIKEDVIQEETKEDSIKKTSSFKDKFQKFKKTEE